MCKLSPVFKQFLAIICCKCDAIRFQCILFLHTHLKHTKTFHISGNLLTLSFGISIGWATINFNELQSEKSTFLNAPLSLDEASLLVSIVNVGGLIGNYAIVPISNLIGIKRSIHILGSLMIVRNAKKFDIYQIQNYIYFKLSN